MKYRFRVEDSGTFWFHPHVRGYDQIERGLYAPFVVTGAEDIDVTADRTFVVDDVKLQATGELAPNGDPLDMMVGKQGNVLLLNGKRNGTIVVESGGRQRWRFVNSANGRYFTLRLGGHPFTVIGNDGGLLPKPYTTDTLLIVPGERYEVLVSFDDPEGTRTMLETLHYDRGHELPDQGARPLAEIVVGPRSDRTLRPVPETLRTIAPLAISAATPMKRFLLQENENGAKDGPTITGWLIGHASVQTESRTRASVGRTRSTSSAAPSCASPCTTSRLECGCSTATSSSTPNAA